MKFANIDSLAVPGATGSSCGVNYGDYVQLVAIDNLYAEMGIGQDSVLHLAANELGRYSGETLILPVNFLRVRSEMSPYIDNKYMGYSEQIIPVFLGLSFKQGFFEINEADVSYLKKYEPIGCRDYNTFLILKKFGLNCYISGCVSLFFEKRKPNSEHYNTVYFVDVPSGLKKYIPDHLLENAKFVHHEEILSEGLYYDRNYMINKTRELIDEYKSRASLVITSRLHCAYPCIAMGIPVIVVKEYMGYPFDLISRFVPFYSQFDFDKIDWNPTAPNIEKYKKMAKKIAIKRIKNTFLINNYREVHDFYFSLWKEGYEQAEMPLVNLISGLKERFLPSSRFNYAVWGVSELAEKICCYIDEHYPNAKLVNVFDSYRKVSFRGIQTKSPEYITANDNYITIVSTINCASAAKPFFDKLGKSASEYIFVADTKLSEKDFN